MNFVVLIVTLSPIFIFTIGVIFIALKGMWEDSQKKKNTTINFTDEQRRIESDHNEEFLLFKKAVEMRRLDDYRDSEVVEKIYAYIGEIQRRLLSSRDAQWLSMFRIENTRILSGINKFIVEEDYLEYVFNSGLFFNKKLKGNQHYVMLLEYLKYLSEIYNEIKSKENVHVEVAKSLLNKSKSDLLYRKNLPSS